MKKILSLCMVLLMLLSFFTTSAFAEDRPSVTRPSGGGGGGGGTSVTTETITTNDPVPDPNDENSPDVLIVEEGTPTGEAEDVVGGDEQASGDDTTGGGERTEGDAASESAGWEEGSGTESGQTQVPVLRPGTYVRIENDEGQFEYILEEEAIKAANPWDKEPTSDSIIAEIELDINGVPYITVTGSVLSTQVEGIDADSDAVYIDAYSYSEAASNIVTFKHEALVELASTGLATSISLDLGTFTFDARLIEVMSERENDIVLEVVLLDVMPDVNIPESNELYCAYELRLLENGEPISFEGGSVTVTVPFDPESGYAGYILDREVVEENKLVVQDGTASWVCSHFSTWVLYRDSVLDTITDESAPLEGAPSSFGSGHIGWWVICISGMAILFFFFLILLWKRRKDDEEEEETEA